MKRYVTDSLYERTHLFGFGYDSGERLRIEQEGLKVTLIIENMNGESEVIEKSLNEYGLVLTGNMPLDDYTNDKLFSLELKNELRMASLRIVHLEELLEYKEKSEGKLFHLLDKSIQSSRSINLDINVSPTTSSSSVAVMSISPLVSQIDETFKKLEILLANNPETIKEIDHVVAEITKIKNKHDKEEVANSSAFSAVRTFLDKFNKAQNTIDTTIESGRKAINLVRKIAKHYNEIADLCGCPRVPGFFLKD